MNNKAKTLEKCEDNLFYIAGPEIILKIPILGTNFLKQHKVAINYFSSSKCEVLAETKNHEHKLAYGPLLVNDLSSGIDFHNVTKLNNICVEDIYFNTKVLFTRTH